MFSLGPFPTSILEETSVLSQSRHKTDPTGLSQSRILAHPHPGTFAVSPDSVDCPDGECKLCEGAWPPCIAWEVGRGILPGAFAPSEPPSPEVPTDLSFASALSSVVILVSNTEATWVLSSVLWPAARLQWPAKKDPRTFVDCIATTEEVVSRPHGSQGTLGGWSLACPRLLHPGTPGKNGRTTVPFTQGRAA